MTIPFAGDFALPVSQALMSILDQELVRSGMVLKGKSSLVFNFRDPDYGPVRGGFHPVEIRLLKRRDRWQFDYVTDFSYQGPEEMADGFGAAFSLDDKDPVRADDQMVDIESIKMDIVVNPIGVVLGPNDLVQLLTNCQFTGITQLEVLNLVGHFVSFGCAIDKETQHDDPGHQHHSRAYSPLIDIAL